ncbi:MAG: hypothetical protein ABIG11_00060 [bacterium]
MEEIEKKSPIFTPGNEPYLGKESLFIFDTIISACLAANKEAAAYSRNHELSDLQKAACQIIPQGISLALSIRELVRQGYLFAAAVLMRPLIERAAIISYLHENPEKVVLWRNGWKHSERPSLAVMLATMNKEADTKQAKEFCDDFNHLVHGDPVGASYNLVKLDSGFGYAPSKMLNNPELCDYICIQSHCFLIVIMARMAGCFPISEKPPEKSV